MKLMYLIGGIVVIILVTGSLFFLFTQENTSSPSLNPQEQATTNSSVEQQAQPFENPCKNSSQDELMDCYIGWGTRHQDAEMCSKLEESDITGICVAGIAVAKSNFGLCERTLEEEQREACVLGFAYETETLEPCEHLSSSAKINACVGVVVAKGLLIPEDCVVLQDSVARRVCTTVSSVNEN